MMENNVNKSGTTVHGTLELKGISKTFKSTSPLNGDADERCAIDNISGILNSGEVVALIGENGSGKSTLLNILSTFLKPSSGSIYFDGKDVFKELRTYRSIVSYVSENGSYVPELSVLSNLEYFSKIFNSSENIQEICEKVGIAEFKDKRPTELSRGQRQRLALAVSMLKQAKIVLLDEPAEGLDIETKAIVKNTVRNYKRLGKLVIYVTHDEDEIEDVCDKIIALRRGKTVFFGTVDEFWNKYEKYYAVTHLVDDEKRTEIMSLDQLKVRKFVLNVVHIRNLGLREILNLADNSVESPDYVQSSSRLNLEE